MSNEPSGTKSTERRLLSAFENKGIEVASIETRAFPGEQIVIVEVIDDYDKALELANELDHLVDEGFITIRKGPPKHTDGPAERVKSVNDPRVTTLVETLKSQSRTSETQPSLKYIADAEERVGLAVAARHHVIFGRRGVGKTSLMLEAKRRVEAEACRTLWVNVHPLRELEDERVFLTIAHRLCSLPARSFVRRTTKPQSVETASKLEATISNLLESDTIEKRRVDRLVPELQQLFKVFTEEIQAPIYVFLDDVHYLPMSEVPRFLDRMHGITRDNAMWLKIAGVKHQMRWFSAEQAIGLQTGHDADVIELDITLEQPVRAKQFLEDILRGYMGATGCEPLSGFMAGASVDRLVLASGGVPRDFLTLAAGAIEGARQRPKARQAGGTCQQV